MDAYNVLSLVGKGACGSVYLVQHKDTEKHYALKKIQLDESRKTRTKVAVLREAKILSSLKHPNIVTYHDSFFDENEEYLCIIQDYCDGGTLEDIINEADKHQTYITEKDIVQWFLQIAMAVRYMHSMKVLHRDLKASNVFMNKSATLCKIGDFGIAKSMDSLDVASTCVGTPCYLSPEMCQDIPYSSKADVWAMGCMLYEMMALRPAFDANNLVSLFYKIVKGEYDPLPEYYSETLKQVVKSILTKVPEERPSARGVLAIPFLKQELLTFIEEKEWLLAQQRLPTRQGSRPYSTPNLKRFNSFLGREAKLKPREGEESSKRAISCRPNIVNMKERSILISARQRSERVSTIPEESDEHSNEKHAENKRSSQTDSTSSPQATSRTAAVNGTADRDSHITNDNNNTSITGSKSEKIKGEVNSDNFIDKEIEVSNRELGVHEPKDNHSDPSGDTFSAKDHDLTSREQGKTNYAKIDVSGLGAGDDPEKNQTDSKKVLKLDFSKVHQQENLNYGDFNSDRPKRHRIQEPMRTPRTVEQRVLIIEPDKPPADEENHVKKNSAPTSSTPVDPPPSNRQASDKKTAANTSNPTPPAPPTAKAAASSDQGGKKNKKKSPPKQKKQEPAKKTTKVASKPEAKPEKKPTNLKTVGTDRHTDKASNSTKNSRINDLSDSDEEIPEEIPDWRTSGGRSISLTQTFEIPEIEEDLPNGLAAEDEDEFNDFEDGDIEEALDEVVTVAKRACDDLESPDITDEVVVDDRRPNTSKMIRKQCMNVLGREKYDTVRKFFENNEEPEIKKIEKAVGKEHSKTIYLMTEINRKKQLNHH